VCSSIQNPQLCNIDYLHYMKGVILRSFPGNYDMKGQNVGHKFLSKMYIANNPTQISEFRTAFYKKLQSLLNIPHTVKKPFSTRSEKDSKGLDYVIYMYQGKDFFAVPNYYHGIGIWTPHLSILSEAELATCNEQLNKQYQISGIKCLVDAMAGTAVELNEIRMQDLRFRHNIH
jgi:hypothetical protein